jgi:membrane protein YqaA with SNARE-associated domain
VKLLLAVFALSFVSALFPLVNAEAMLAWAATQDDARLVVAAALAAVGQVLGKLIWYYAGIRTFESGWVQRKLAKSRSEKVLARWQTRTQDRPLAAGALVFSAAFTGLPPYLAVAAVAGPLGVGVRLFVVTGLVGRFLRFWLVLELASYSWLLVR